MVLELFDENEYRELISKNDLIIIGISNKEGRLWKYLEALLKSLESQVDPDVRVSIVDVEIIKNALQKFETEMARRRTLIKAFLNGVCVFVQEDVTENIANDIEMLKRGIRDSLKRYSINLKFAAKR